jgi:hypothetical protein
MLIMRRRHGIDGPHASSDGTWSGIDRQGLLYDLEWLRQHPNRERRSPFPTAKMLKLLGDREWVPGGIDRDRWHQDREVSTNPLGKGIANYMVRR